MRNLHRWIGSVALLFLAWVAVTGVLLALDTLYPPTALRAPADAPGSADDRFVYDRSGPLLSEADLENLLAASLRAAFASARIAAPTAVDIQLRIEGAQPLASVVVTSDRVQTFNIDAAAGKLLSATTVWRRPGAGAAPWYDDVARRLRWHDLLHDLHRGSIIGIGGQVMDLLTGLSFVVLSATGVGVYIRMLAARRRSGRAQPFWR